MIDKGILEKTLEFAPGEWLLSSYIATGMENGPIFIKAGNAEKEIKKYLKSTKLPIAGKYTQVYYWNQAG